MKTCIKCSNEKSKAEFHKDNLRSDGLFPYCKKCRITSKKPYSERDIKTVLSFYSLSSNGCWEWTGTKMQKEDYGIAHFNGGRYRAHRLSYLYHKGQIKEGMLICHTCDNPICINPSHLYQGTPKQNSSDMVIRNRQNKLKGEDASCSKLKAYEIIKIRADNRGHKYIAADYGIAVSTVSGIKTRRNWSHI